VRYHVERLEQGSVNVYVSHMMNTGKCNVSINILSVAVYSNCG